MVIQNHKLTNPIPKEDSNWHIMFPQIHTQHYLKTYKGAENAEKEKEEVRETETNQKVVVGHFYPFP